MLLQLYQHMPKLLLDKAQRAILIGILIVFAAGSMGVNPLLHLLAEVRISLFGVETPAHVYKVQTLERDDGDRRWKVDLINYTFTIPEGYVFAGVNEANVSQTESLIGRPDANGNYSAGIVQYLPREPKIHRLKGWGYDGYGPPGGMANLAFRAACVLSIIGVACLYAYTLFEKSRRP